MRYFQSALTHLECPQCAQRYDAERLQSTCQACGAPLQARYNLQYARQTLTPQLLTARPRGLWRWAEVLPVRQAANRITLGEGDTPLLHAANLGAALGFSNLYIKDETTNPGGSVEARSAAVSLARAIELGARAFVAADSGIAGSALALYAARARAHAHIIMLPAAPQPVQLAIQACGVASTRIGGTQNDALEHAALQAAQNHWLNVTPGSDPYQIEGKKTLGFELAETFGWQLPDVIIYPTHSGAGLIGMWKAFEELEQIGLISPARPRMVSVQPTRAPNLQPMAARLVQNIIQQSQGTTQKVTDEEMLACQRDLARTEGIFAAPQGAATLAALKRLQHQGWLRPHEQIVLINTSSGLNWL